MSRRKIKERNIRKITKVGRGSYAITLPIEIVREFGWRERQKVVIRANKKRKTITIKDWQN